MHHLSLSLILNDSGEGSPCKPSSWNSKDNPQFRKMKTSQEMSQNKASRGTPRMAPMQRTTQEILLGSRVGNGGSPTMARTQNTSDQKTTKQMILGVSKLLPGKRGGGSPRMARATTKTMPPRKPMRRSGNESPLLQTLKMVVPGLFSMRSM